MQIVIDIPEEDYNFIKRQVADGITNPLKICIANGIPLPKGHGDLIDISKLPITTTYFGISDKPREVVNYNCILNAKKIIKTDKTESEK